MVHRSGVPAEDTVRLRSQLTAQLYKRLGERRIDMLMCVRNEPDDRPVVQTARRDGVELVTL